jgi:hypothetical protein
MTESPQQALRERVEDLEDARELDAAIRRHGDKPLIPWTKPRKNWDWVCAAAREPMPIARSRKVAGKRYTLFGPKAKE